MGSTSLIGIDLAPHAFRSRPGSRLRGCETPVRGIVEKANRWTAADENPLLGATADRFQANIASSDRKWYNDLRNQAASPSKKVDCMVRSIAEEQGNECIR
jgi:hypothetical protein